MTDRAYDPEFVAAVLLADELPPEATFDNIETLLAWLDAPGDAA